MGRKPSTKCRHGNSLVYFEGCPHCIAYVRQAGALCALAGYSPQVVLGLLALAYSTRKNLEDAKERAEAKWRELAEKTDWPIEDIAKIGEVAQAGPALEATREERA